ncbi:ATP-binding protein [Stappia stellulata]|uniref:ATP-binding protein n=1 Tax=Stappia stellulata TaxID=71235 RepID=UPI0004262893|nr:ATP-binding protein [Stappia stellulata]
MTTSSQDKSDFQALTERLDTLISLISRAVPPAPEIPDFAAADAFVWSAGTSSLTPVARVNRIDISLLQGVDRARNQLVENTRRFAKGFAANNVLLWGARGMGKSSLVKSVHAFINREFADKGDATRLKLVEIHREDIETLPELMSALKQAPHHTILFCDDLSFDNDDTSYKSLKAALDGGIEGRPDNVLFYATSNRRHLLPRDMIENERSTAINPGEAVEEKVSLSDRFGLWLGFHKCSQDDYLDMINAYAGHFELEIEPAELRSKALEWATTRGSRSGRVAFQFIQDLAGQLGKHLKN